MFSLQGAVNSLSQLSLGGLDVIVVFLLRHLLVCKVASQHGHYFLFVDRLFVSTVQLIAVHVSCEYFSQTVRCLPIVVDAVVVVVVVVVVVDVVVVVVTVAAVVIVVGFLRYGR